jgi:hypothetical protein
MTDLGASSVKTNGLPATRPRVVAVAVTTRRRRSVLHMLGEVARSGGEALLVTADGGRGDKPATGVTHLDLLADERRWGPNRLLTVDPRRVLAILTRRPRPPGAAPVWRRWVASRPYRSVRYWVLWRVARHHLDVLRPDQVSHVLIVGIESWPIAWHLLRSSPEATIGFSVPVELLGSSGELP